MRGAVGMTDAAARGQACVPADFSAVQAPDTLPAPALSRVHAHRLRDVYRSAGWPFQDAVEVELLAAGLLERVDTVTGHDRVRLTDAGLRGLARALQSNRQAMSEHQALVGRVARSMLREGRIVWTGLRVRAPLPPLETPQAATGGEAGAGQADGAAAQAAAAIRWKMCLPDVFSIRHTTVAAYLEPVVHEIKVSRADLLGDLKSPDKRASYLAIGGQCWYVLGCDARGRPIAQADEVPAVCGVLVAAPDGRLEVARYAPRRPVPDLPFALWMALARATPVPPLVWQGADEPDQALLPARDPEADTS